MEQKINFRAQFKLHPNDSELDIWIILQKKISNWINNIVQNENTKPAIYRGIVTGDLEYNRDHNEIVVKSFEEGGVKYWALRFTHPESSGTMANWRYWISDIALEKKIDGNILFSMTNSFRIRSGFIGDIPEPSINSPNIIKTIVSGPDWRCLVDEDILSLSPIQLTNDNVKRFLDFIFNKKRTVPIVYISKRANGAFLLDPNELSLKIVGNAFVYYESETSVSEYFRSLPYFTNYRCSNGAVRIYLPNANHSRSSDFKNHRFYTENRIFVEGPDTVLKVIAESVVRRSLFYRHAGVQTIDDIEKKIINKQLREAIKGNNSQEIIESYQKQVESLGKEIEGKDQELSQYCNLYDDASSETEFHKNVAKELERKNYELHQQNESLQEAISSGPKVVFDLEDLPTSLAELLELLEQKYKDEVVVLQEAKDSADEFEMKDPKNLKKSWRALKSIPEILFPILFGEDEGDKQALYVNQAGFDLSMTESKMTKADKKLRDLRTRTYKDDEIEINAHIGFGNKKPNMLRVHFYVSSDDNKIVIGHCGDHLDNFSTKSLS